MQEIDLPFLKLAVFLSRFAGLHPFFCNIFHRLLTCFVFVSQLSRKLKKNILFRLTG